MRSDFYYGVDSWTMANVMMVLSTVLCEIFRL